MLEYLGSYMCSQRIKCILQVIVGSGSFILSGLTGNPGYETRIPQRKDWLVVWASFGFACPWLSKTSQVLIFQFHNIAFLGSMRTLGIYSRSEAALPETARVRFLFIHKRIV